jgi:hypothetical protein
MKILGHNAADPQDSQYGGTPIAIGSYTLNQEKNWDYNNQTTEIHYNNKLGEFEFYRLNFKEFNT